MAGKKFSFIDVILSVICVVFVAEAAAPAAAIGNAQFFWWIFLIITFLLPYGMVVAELGTTYDSDGGLYDWVREALGDKWGSRVAWYYWINFPLWIASCATLFPDIIGFVTGMEFTVWGTLAIETSWASRWWPPSPTPWPTLAATSPSPSWLEASPSPQSTSSAASALAPPSPPSL